MPLQETDTVAILVTDLNQWQIAMRWAHGLSMSLDLAEGYRDGKPGPKASRLTNLIARSHDKIEVYLNDEVPTTESLLSD